MLPWWVPSRYARWGDAPLHTVVPLAAAVLAVVVGAVSLRTVRRRRSSAGSTGVVLGWCSGGARVVLGY